MTRVFGRSAFRHELQNAGQREAMLLVDDDKAELLEDVLSSKRTCVPMMT
jgi:hypothetical protein